MNWQSKGVSALKKVVKSLLLLLAATAMTVGLSLPAQAQSVTVCVEAHVEIAGTTVVDQPENCVVLPPA